MTPPPPPARFQRVVVEPELAESGVVAEALAGLSKRSSFVRRFRSERNTRHYWIELVHDGEPIRLFVKRYLPPLTRNLLTPLLCSRAEREYRNSRGAHALGLPAVPAVAFAERRRLGIVTDQLVAFRTIAPLRPLDSILRRARVLERARAKYLPLFARELAVLHEAGVVHGSASPRNLLRTGTRDARAFVWIDHPSAVLFDRSVRAGPAALADLFQAFESLLLVPDGAARAAFLANYAPEDPAFQQRALAAWDGGQRAKDRRRRLALKSLFSRSSAADGWSRPSGASANTRS